MLEGQRQKEITKRKKAILYIGGILLISNQTNCKWEIFNLLIRKFGSCDNGFYIPYALFAAHIHRYPLQTVNKAFRELRKARLIYSIQQHKMESKVHFINWEIIKEGAALLKARKKELPNWMKKYKCQFMQESID